jgi:phosphoglycerate kinase
MREREMTTLDGIRGLEQLELKGRRVFIRVDFDVPLDEGLRVTSDERILAALPTVNYVQKSGAKVILASHLGKPVGPEPRFGLEPVGSRLAELTGWEILLPDDCVGDAAKKVVQDAREGQVVLLENLGFHPEEAENDEGFARRLAEITDVYVNEAFSASHHAHASLDALARLTPERGVGYLMHKELSALERVTSKPARPFVLIVGGERLATKLDLIEHLLELCDVLCVGGAVASTLLVASGHDLQAGKHELQSLPRARRLIERAAGKLVLPSDLVVAEAPSEAGGTAHKLAWLPKGSQAFDLGPETIARFSAEVAKAGTVLWLGPLGYFENPAFALGSLKVAHALSNSSAFSVVSGEHSLKALALAGQETLGKLSHLSPGGRSTLELLEGRRLPGVEALRS